MTTIEMDNYMDDNLAVWNAVTGYRQQVELCKELRRKREARQRAKAIQRERRRLATVLVVTVLLGAILVACVSLVNAYTDKSAGITPSDNEPISTLAGAELLNNAAPTVQMLEVTAATFAEAETEPAFVYRLDVPLTEELQETVWDACQEHNVEYALVLGLIEVESTFRTDAVSYVGCYGLMQLNPQYFPSDLSPAENIQYGVAFLAEKLDQYTGDIGAALTAYNAGHDTGNREYAEKVMAAAERWKAE